MGVMGWSTTAMAARYQHITAEIRHDIAKQVGGLIWKPPKVKKKGRKRGKKGATETKTETK
jgi:integrase